MGTLLFYLFVFIYVSPFLGVLVNSKSGSSSPKRSLKKVFENKWLSKYDRWRGIIKNHTEITNEDNLTPEIKLHLITPTCSLWTADTRSSPFKNIPYFGFYWAGGQGLSRYILDNPSIVKGQRVLDLGSGCGATAIAAVLAGAKSVTANDIDPIACVAADMNAQLNKVSLEISADNIILHPKNLWDVVLVGNFVCKRKEKLSAVDWLKDLVSRGKVVVIGDPGRPFVKLFTSLEKLAEYNLPDDQREMHGDFTKTKVFNLSRTF